MNKPIISMIAAIDQKRGIGREKKLLFDIPEDMKYFKEKTKGHVVIMGRKTYESIGKPLPNRTNIVITRNSYYKIPNDIIICLSLEEALEKARQIEKEEIFIIGGAQIYEQGIKYANKLYITKVKGSYDADTFFPEYKNLFKSIIFAKSSSDENHEYEFLVIER